MTDRQRYTYVTLRYSHDIVSGEFVNVGVVMLSEGGNLLIRTRKTIGRIKAIFPDLDREAFVLMMKSLDRSVVRLSKQISKDSLFLNHQKIEGLAAKILANDDSSLRWSTVSGGLTSNPTATFERLYERFVAKYDVPSKRRIQDEDVWRPVREKLDERGVALQFESKLIEGKADSIEFSKSWKNGSWHVYESLSMDLADADGIKDKARRWRGHLEAVADGTHHDVGISFVIGKPSNPSLMSAFAKAVEILSDAPFINRIYDDSEIGLLVDEIQTGYANHIHQLKQ